MHAGACFGGGTEGNLARMESPILPVWDADRIDEDWIDEWVRFGFAEMTAYLHRQAAFEDYYQRRADGLATAG